ncbi:MAG: EF-hand domain-containing protein [Candidatus Hydrogenedentes bacterium]|nr:EF-hand domain-containing protein [Candidatus Hydrogenedentota bacterium]
MLNRWNATTSCRTLFAVGVVASFAHTAYAQDEPREGHHPRPNQFLKDADRNGDRQLSFEEASAAIPRMTAERFERMDQNGDGQLTPNEMHRWRARGGDRDSEGRGRGSRGFEHVDTNGDGLVSYEEVNAVRHMPQERFDRMDEDGDGFLSREELRRDHRRGGEGRHGDPARRFEKADANGDGELSFDEFSAVAPRMNEHIFSRIDANGDGVVTLQEMVQHRPPHEGGRQGDRHPRAHGDRRQDFGPDPRP